MKWKIRGMVSNEAYGTCNFTKHEVSLNLATISDHNRSRAALVHELVHVLHGKKPTDKGHQNIVELAEVIASLNGLRQHISYPADMDYYDNNVHIKRGYTFQNQSELFKAILKLYCYHFKIPTTEQTIQEYARFCNLELNDMVKAILEGKELELEFTEV